MTNKDDFRRMKMTLKTQISPIFKRTLSYVNPKKLPCLYATNNQRSLECDLTSKNSFLMPPKSKYFLIQPNWFPLLELIKKKNSHFRNRSVAGTRRCFLVILLLQLFKLHQTSLSKKIFQLHKCTYPSLGLNSEI